MTSFPSAIPERVKPKVNVGPLEPEILVGVALERVAVPPLMDRSKSLTVIAPVRLLLANTISLKVTVTSML